MKKEISPGISVDPDVRFGKPVLSGTRVPVETLVGKVASGMAAEEVAQAYGVTLAGVHAALAYAAHLVEEEHVRAVG